MYSMSSPLLVIIYNLLWGGRLNSHWREAMALQEVLKWNGYHLNRCLGNCVQTNLESRLFAIMGVSEKAIHCNLMLLSLRLKVFSYSCCLNPYLGTLLHMGSIRDIKTSSRYS